MVYNTGDMRDIGKEKPILDPDDVMPYLKYIKDYPLPSYQLIPSTVGTCFSAMGNLLT